MRKNCQMVIKSFEAGKPHRSVDAIWTDGRAIFSYNTVLVEPEADGLAINMTKYTVTTTTHQNSLLRYFAGRVGRTVMGVPKGTRSLAY